MNVEHSGGTWVMDKVKKVGWGKSSNLQAQLTGHMGAASTMAIYMTLMLLVTI
jgi:hypothetical protein